MKTIVWTLLFLPLAAVMLALPLNLAACGGGKTSRPEYDEAFVVMLIGRLQNENAAARFCAARALGQVRIPAVQNAVAPLRCLLYDVNHDVRREAERTLRKIEPCIVEIGWNNRPSGSPL